MPANHILASEKAIAQILEMFSPDETIASLSFIKQHHLEHYPEDGSVTELKKQQLLLEHMEYVFRDIQASKDNSLSEESFRIILDSSDMPRRTCHHENPPAS